MNFTDNLKPELIEPGMKYFLHNALKEAHKIKEEYHNTVYNVGLFILFLIILGGMLVYKYKGKLTPREIAENNKKKQHYLLERIQRFQTHKLHEQQELITGLPHWENEYKHLHGLT